MEIEKLIENKLRLVFNDESLVFDKSRFAGGLTNYNYIMEIKGTDYVVRQPGGMTDQMIDRKIEKVNNSIASELGLNSECIYFDEVSGIKISVYIQNSHNIALADPCDPSNLRIVSALMKKTHSAPTPFPNVFDWKAELVKYERIVEKLNGDFFFDYVALKQQLLDFMDKHMEDTISVPCHNDTVPENFVLTDEGKGYLIDWEYAGMNDPGWDVAAYILESRLSGEAIQHFLMEYYGKLPAASELLKIKCYMMAQDLLWTVWALVRHYSGEDFLDYCCIRYERFRKNIKAISTSPDYSIHNMVKN